MYRHKHKTQKRRTEKLPSTSKVNKQSDSNWIPGTRYIA